MAAIYGRYSDRVDLEVVDVGSYDVNGTFKDIMLPSWKYTGVDRVPGPNVDEVMVGDYEFPSLSADLVISGSCFQYVGNPFKLMAAIYGIIKPGGIVVVYAPRDESEGLIGLPPELCPDGNTAFDCWRFCLNGMEAVLEEAGFTVEKVFYFNGACWGIGVK